MPLPMTDEECVAGMRRLQPQIARYAKLLVQQGVNLQKGQELVVECPIELADFCRQLVATAYECGASHVTVLWADDETKRLEYEHVGLDWFEHVPSWKKEQLNSLAEAGAAFLFIEGQDPEAFKGIDPAKPAAASRAAHIELKAFHDGMDFGRNTWCIAGAPIASWAHKVFPALSENEATYRLWEAILQVSRASGEDPREAWETHNAAFKKNKRFLNEHHFDRLHYRSQNGTDLTVGMTPRHIWEGGAAHTVKGLPYFPNIPTEEVFTSPDRMRVDGIVHSALPLVHAGSVVRDFWFRFEGGKVVEYDAAQGKDVLKHILETDENACRLGECALISKNTPIRESGILFYDTLYDENASCHLALGIGFPECYESGFSMSEQELLDAGVNQSHTHVDFMIGTEDMDITGITASGEEVPIFVNGQWAWE